MNLGSPDSTNVKDVRKYLTEFLMDGRVMDMAWWKRTLLVRGLIIPFRAKKSAEAYKTIWRKDGSPLVKITEDFAEKVQVQLNDISVAVAMRYGSMTPAKALQTLEENGCTLEEILITPMYPHYAMSSYETAMEHVISAIKAQKPSAKIRVLKPFFSEAKYISAMAETIKPFLAKHDYDAILFSYHGIPIRHLEKSDTTQNHCYVTNECCEVKSVAWETCYKHQVKANTKLVAESLNLPKEKVLITFQSRLDDGWIKPYTDVEFEALPKRGVKKLLVLSPAFVTDCLETLEELDIRGKEMFLENGGETFERVPCLNTDTNWINAFVSYCKEAEGNGLWN